MIDGHSTLSSIERAIRDIHRDEQEIRRALEDANNRQSELIEQRLQHFRTLAEVRTRNALSDGVVDEADRLTYQVKALLQARQKTITSLQNRLTTALKSYDEELVNYHKLGEEIARLEKQLDKFAEEAKKKLGSSKTYRQENAVLDERRAVYEKAREKTDLAEKDQEKKGAPYQNDPLFMYLWKRKYKMEDYKPNRLIRWLDDWIAGLVRYQDARANYAVLLEIPVRLKEHAKKLGGELAQQQLIVDKLLAGKVKELAGHDLVTNLNNAREKHTSKKTTLENSAAENSDIVAQMNNYARGSDHAFSQAVTISAQFLEQKSLSGLMELARETATPSDDELVHQIGDIENNIKILKKDKVGYKDELENLFKRNEELIQLADKFRHAHYDSPGSVFNPGSDLNIFLEELVKGAITGAQYWDRAQSRHRWHSRPADPFRRDAGFPPYDMQHRGNFPDFADIFDNQDDFNTGGGF